MATGKLLNFDADRGYGFVAADDGGEDIFLHASVFDGDTANLVVGLPLEFEVMSGDRGRKAFAARSAQGSVATMRPARPAAVQETEDDQLCDALSRAEYGAELTELLLKTIPALTGAQILEVRQGLLESAMTHGWIDA